MRERWTYAWLTSGNVHAIQFSQPLTPEELSWWSGKLGRGMKDEDSSATWVHLNSNHVAMVTVLGLLGECCYELCGYGTYAPGGGDFIFKRPDSRSPQATYEAPPIAHRQDPTVPAAPPVSSAQRWVSLGTWVVRNSLDETVRDFDRIELALGPEGLRFLLAGAPVLTLSLASAHLDAADDQFARVVVDGAALLALDWESGPKAMAVARKIAVARGA